MLKLTPYQIKTLQACGFEIDAAGETATREVTVTLLRFDDVSWHHEVMFPDDPGRTLDDLMRDLADREPVRDGES